MQAPDASAFQLQSQGNPWYGLFQGLAQGAINFGQNWSAMTNAQTNKDVGNSQIGLNNANTQMTLLNKDWAPKLWGADLRGKKIQNDISAIDLKYHEEGVRLDNNIRRATLVGMQLSNDSQFIMNQWLPFEKQVGFMTSVQEFSNKILEGKLTEKNIEKAQKDIEMYAYEKLVKMSEVNVNDARVSLMNAQEMTEDAKYWNIKADTEGKGYDNDTKRYGKGVRLPEDKAREVAREVAKATVAGAINSAHQSNYDYNVRRGLGWAVEPSGYVMEVGKGFF